MLYEGQKVYYIGFDNYFLDFMDVLEIHDLENGLYVVKINSENEWEFSGYIDRSLIKTKEELFSIFGVEHKI